MVRCYLTGTEFDLKQGFVLNRRWVREQITALNEQAARYERLLAQFGPLDQVTEPRTTKTFKRHRLVCQAAALALAGGAADAKLFIPWADYAAHADKYRAARRKQHTKGSAQPTPP